MAELYWHRISIKKRKELLAKGITIGEVLEKYKQPSWCNYPEALSGGFGCWALGSLDIKVNKKYCGSCDCAKHYKPKVIE